MNPLTISKAIKTYKLMIECLKDPNIISITDWSGVHIRPNSLESVAPLAQWEVSRMNDEVHHFKYFTMVERVQFYFLATDLLEGADNSKASEEIQEEE